MPITYDNKEDVREVFLPRKNTITAADLNEIKEVVNNLEAMVKAMGGHYANYFNYATGQAPTLADFETQIGFPLINGAKFGDTIVFDNVGYTVGSSMFNNVGLIGFLKCSAETLQSASFRNNSITMLFLPLTTIIDTKSFGNNLIQEVYIPLCVTLLSTGHFSENQIQYFNAPIIQQIGGTTGDNTVFDSNTGNNITVIAPSIHQTSNGGGLEGDLQYLDDENTVTFVWDGDEVPDWIKCCSFITL
jgi:hypothetical protein